MLPTFINHRTIGKLKMDRYAINTYDVVVSLAAGSDSILFELTL